MMRSWPTFWAMPSRYVFTCSEALAGPRSYCVEAGVGESSGMERTVNRTQVLRPAISSHFRSQVVPTYLVQSRLLGDLVAQAVAQLGEAPRLEDDQRAQQRGDDRQRDERRELDRGREQRDEHDRADQALRAEAVHVAPAECDVREQVDRRAAEQRGGGHDLQRVLDVAERLLQAEGPEHDAGDHREVQVGERVARDLVALRPG